MRDLQTELDRVQRELKVLLTELARIRRELKGSLDETQRVLDMLAVDDKMAAEVVWDRFLAKVDELERDQKAVEAEYDRLQSKVEELGRALDDMDPDA